MSFGIYIHYPYCRRLCPYCDFNVSVIPDTPHDPYRDAVISELEIRANDFDGRGAPVSIYFGGGTPGMWPAERIGDVIAAINSRFGRHPECEITVEFNPEDAEPECLASLRQTGVNRLSFGIQSFDDNLLGQLGRAHSGEQAQHAVRVAESAGFQNISVDLMHGYIGQSLQGALDDVRTACELPIQHISSYQLTIEDKTLFGRRARRGESLLESDERLVEMFTELRRLMALKGFIPYEVCSASQIGYEAVHNQLYWLGEEYLALGAGAHGFVRRPDGGLRWSNIRNPRKYMSKAIAGGCTSDHEDLVSHDELTEEVLWTGLRLDRGVQVTDDMRRRFGSMAETLIMEGLLVSEDGRWRASESGRPLLDSLILRLVANPSD